MAGIVTLKGVRGKNGLILEGHCFVIIVYHAVINPVLREAEWMLFIAVIPFEVGQGFPRAAVLAYNSPFISNCFFHDAGASK